MRLLAVLLSLFVAFQPFAWVGQAQASEVTYNLGAIKGDVPCHKIGALLMAEGVALINGDDISVQSKEKAESAAHEVLSGKLLRKAENGSGPSHTLNGIAYFYRGSVLSSLEPHCSGESVDRTDGTKVVGHITDISNDAVKILPLEGAEQTIPMSNVTAIHSPKVFNFSMHLANSSTEDQTVKGDARNIIFEPTCRPPLAGGISRKKVVIVVAVALLVATAVACSVAIPLSVHHHHATNNNELSTLILANKQPVTSVPIPQTNFRLPLIPFQRIPKLRGAPPKGVVSLRYLSKLPPPPPPQRVIFPPRLLRNPGGPLR